MTNAIHRLLVEGVEPDYANLVAHPLASIMPMMSEEEFERYKADIKRNGLQVRIDLFEGMILEGRNRYRALRALGIVLVSSSSQVRRPKPKPTSSRASAPAQQQAETRVRADDNPQVPNRERPSACSTDVVEQEHDRRRARCVGEHA
jgi:hypothetical protein